MSWTPEKIEETQKALKAAVATDLEFRESFKADPKGTFEKIAGETVPDGFTIRVVDLGDTDLTIVLPKIKPADLSDEELENVAGGIFGMNHTQEMALSFALTAGARGAVAGGVAAGPVGAAVLGLGAAALGGALGAVFSLF